MLDRLASGHYGTPHAFRPVRSARQREDVVSRFAADRVHLFLRHVGAPPLRMLCEAKNFDDVGAVGSELSAISAMASGVSFESEIGSWP